jgi:multidrug efflux system membrane fusion protein
MSRVTRFARCSAAALAVVLVAAGCGAKPRMRSPRVPVTVAKVIVRAVPLVITATGTVEAAQNADVGSQVGGVVTRVAFAEGQEVKAGQVLFELDPRPFRNALEAAQATLARDRAQAKTARKEADRAKQLFEQNVLSQAEWDQKRAASESAVATVRSDEAAVANARLNLQYATIRAPVSGQTGRLMVHAGDLVKAATSDPLVKVVQTRPIRVRFPVPVSDVPLVQRFRRGDPRVEVTIPGGDSLPITGRLVFVDNAVDEASGTLLLKGEFPNRDGALVPGQFVDVRLVLEQEHDRLVVPAAAVSRGQEGAFVYVVQPDSTVQTKPVSVERTLDDLVVLNAGVEAGESVITDGQLRLAPGSKVIVREAGQGRSRAAQNGAGAGPGDSQGGARRLAGSRGRKP